MVTVAVAVVAKNFAEWHDKALEEPVIVTKDGEESVVVVSAETFRRLTAEPFPGISAAEIEAIVANGSERNDIPTEYRWNSSDEVVGDAQRGV